jgi:L-amino acid N-acyltransferase
MTTIRPAKREDLPAILEIYNDAVLTTTATYDYEPRSLEHRLAWFEDHVNNGYPVFVAEDENRKIVGWSSLSRFHDRKGFRYTTENSIYVTASQRGRGIGRQLLEPLIESARRQNYRVIIAAIDAENSASIKLHERYGFEVVGHFKRVGYKFDRWLDVIYMELLV